VFHARKINAHITQNDFWTLDAHKYCLKRDTHQAARAPSAQNIAALQLQLQLHAAGAYNFIHAISRIMDCDDAAAAECNRLGDDLLSSLQSDLSAAAAIRSCSVASFSVR
jgi:hypothetical protein